MFKKLLPILMFAFLSDVNAQRITPVNDVDQSKFSKSVNEKLDQQELGVHSHADENFDGKEILNNAFQNGKYDFDSRTYPRFEENKGQWESNIKIRTKLSSGLIYFEQNRIGFHFYEKSKAYEAIHNGNNEAQIGEEVTWQNFIGANQSPEITFGGEKTQYQQSYFLGNDESKWASNVSTYSQINYKNLYPGIDLVYKSFQNYLKYDFIVKAGSNPSLIKVHYEGAQKTELSQNGNLQVSGTLGAICEFKPIAYQIINGKRKEIECNFKLENNVLSYSFPIGYNNAYELIIDPSLIASTYTGSTADNWGFTATYDALGHMYIGGIALGLGYPTTVGAFQTNYNGGDGSGGINCDITLGEFNATGTALLSASYIGGAGNETPHSLVVRSNGNIYLFGKTTSNNYPTTAGCFDNTYNTNTDIFVSRLNTTFTSLLSSTYVGGTGIDGAVVNNNFAAAAAGEIRFQYGDSHRGQIALDNSNNVYVGSSTRSANFPFTAGSFDNTLNGASDGVVFKLNNTLTTLDFSTFLGGNAEDGVFGITVNPTTNEVFVTGATASNNFPTTAGVIGAATFGGIDAFCTRINATGSALIASTYLGTANKDGGFYNDLDAAGNILIYGLSFV